MAAVARAGLMQGVSPMRFAPSGAVTREQLAVVAARALRLSVTAALTFKDERAIAPWALAAVREAVAVHLLAAYRDGTFRPTSPATRAVIAQAVAGMIVHEALPA